MVANRMRREKVPLVGFETCHMKSGKRENRVEDIFSREPEAWEVDSEESADRRVWCESQAG